MGCSDIPTAVFIETNLGTRLAVPASPDITAEDFKREVERTHLNCFPELGNIKVNAVMVKQKLHCYHLSGSLPLKYAFPGSNFTWFLQTRVNRVEPLKYEDSKDQNLNSSANVIADSVEMEVFMMPSCEKRTKCKRKKVNAQRFQNFKPSMLKIFAVSCCLGKRKMMNVKRKCKIGNPRRGPLQRSPTENPGTNMVTDATGEAISEPPSVSGIINKYFSDYDEVASSPGYFSTTLRYRHKKQLNRGTECEYPIASDKMSPATGHLVSQDVLLEKPSSGRTQKADVGKRLLLASDSLGLAPSNRRSILSLCRYNGGESQLHTCTATVRNLVFDIRDEGD